VIETIASEHAGAPIVSRLDGLLVRYDTWWFNIRASNTEPVLRLNLEADTKDEMGALRDGILGRIQTLVAASLCKVPLWIVGVVIFTSVKLTFTL